MEEEKSGAPRQAGGIGVASRFAVLYWIKRCESMATIVVSTSWMLRIRWALALRPKVRLNPGDKFRVRESHVDTWTHGQHTS